MSSLPLRGARTGNTYLRYHLACRNNRPLIPAPTRRLPVNAGNASEDTEGSRLVLPALSGPFAAPLFAPLSAPGTLCGCALQLYFRFIGFMQYRLTPLNHKCVPLSSTIFHPRRMVGIAVYRVVSYRTSRDSCHSEGAWRPVERAQWSASDLRSIERIVCGHCPLNCNLTASFMTV